MLLTWEHVEFTHPYIAPPELVDAENRKVPMSTAAANSGGVSLLSHHLKRLGTLDYNVARMRTTEYFITRLFGTVEQEPGNRNTTQKKPDAYTYGTNGSIESHLVEETQHSQASHLP